MYVSIRVSVKGYVVEGPDDKSKFPSDVAPEECDSLDQLVKGIQHRWGVNSEIEVFVWPAASP